MTRLFLDTSVVIVAIGGAHPQREACRGIIARVASGEIAAHASVELIQELAFHRLRTRGPEDAVARAREAAAMLTVHDLTAEVMGQALDLMLSGHLRGRDAVHAATARAGGFDRIVTLDADFADVDGLQAVRPDDC